MEESFEEQRVCFAKLPKQKTSFPQLWTQMEESSAEQKITTQKSQSSVPSQLIQWGKKQHRQELSFS